MYEEILGIIGQNPRVSKSHRLHVMISQILFICSRYIPYIHLKWLVFFLKSWTLIGYFSNSIGSSVISSWFFPFIETNPLSMALEMLDDLNVGK